MEIDLKIRVSRQPDIKIIVFIRQEVHSIMTYEGEYRNLMALLYDKFYIEDFGECKGVGRCGTCHVHILNPTGESLNKEGNESTTLSKMALVNNNSRLACQIMINQKLHGLQVKVVLPY